MVNPAGLYGGSSISVPFRNVAITNLCLTHGLRADIECLSLQREILKTSWYDIPKLLSVEISEGFPMMFKILSRSYAGFKNQGKAQKIWKIEEIVKAQIMCDFMSSNGNLTGFTTKLQLSSQCRCPGIRAAVLSHITPDFGGQWKCTAIATSVLANLLSLLPGSLAIFG